MSDPKFVIGVDEVGYGAIAGPLVVAAVAFRAQLKRVTAEWNSIHGVKTLVAGDSKRIRSPDRRAVLSVAIRAASSSTAIIERSAVEIDARLIRTVYPEAVQLAIQRCTERLVSENPGLKSSELLVLIDGDLVRPSVPCPVQMIPGGDAEDWRIGAASIVAKACHDLHVEQMVGANPTWEFDKHRGYPTKGHLKKLEDYGLLDHVHRKTFAPVRASRGPIPGLEE